MTRTRTATAGSRSARAVSRVCHPVLVAARVATVAVLASVLSLGLGGGVAMADGDPASDVLFGKNVFLPYPPPSRAASEALAASVAAVYAKHERVKVALIASPADLGAIPSLFGKPKEYAQFLGQELSSFYAGPLVVVMHAGLGVYDAGRSTAAEERVLGGLEPAGGTADDLAATATKAIGMLLAANALVSKDIRAPTAYPYGAVRHGTRISLRYLLLDDSGRAAALLWLLEGHETVARFRIRYGAASRYTPRSVPWSPPRGLRLDRLTFCVSGSDAAGNKSRPVCGPLRVQ
jgi:hypothetical protein